MHSAVRVVYDEKRGCGYRTKLGAMYLMSDGHGLECGLLPLPLQDCERCLAMGLHCGLKPTRGWTWFNPSKLFDWPNLHCRQNGNCGVCPMQKLSRLERAGILWIGAEFYPSPIDFDEESNRLGISRRLPADQVPRGFKVGEDWVFLAHQKAVTRFDEASGKLVFERGVFRVFKPSRIEVIVTEETPNDEIEAYLERGLTPVIVRRVEQREMELHDELV